MRGKMRRSSERSGFTLVELLVVMAIIGMLVAILLPAVGSARESARLMTCKNNLRQQAVGLMSYAQDFPEALPSIWQRGNLEPWENFSWRVSLLPYLEEQGRFDAINQDLEPLDPKNLAVAGTIEVFCCPSSPRSPRLVDQLNDRTELALGCTDYAPVFDVFGPELPFVQSGTWFGAAAPELFSLSEAADAGPMAPDPGQRVERDEYSAEVRKVPSTFRRVRDGLSNTVLLVEQAGKPRVETSDIPLHHGTTRTEDDLPSEGAWLTAEFASYNATGVNQDNHSGPYGYHAGASVVMCDGSVHFWTQDMSEEVMRALLTRDGSEIVSEYDW